MLVLHDYWRSGTSHRVRIALELKGLAYRRVPIDLRAKAHKQAPYLNLNPQGLVPALVTADGMTLTQSPAILEWVEETYPEPPLLPKDSAARARVRAMAALVACDIHPLGNLRVLEAVRACGQDDAGVAAWAVRWIREGFDALEALMDGPGPWCWNGRITLADCCVVPQIYAATSRYGFDLEPYPRLAALARAADAHPAFQAAHPERHKD